MADQPAPGADAQRLHPETPSVSPAVVAMVIDILTALFSASAKGAGRRLADGSGWRRSWGCTWHPAAAERPRTNLISRRVRR